MARVLAFDLGDLPWLGKLGWGTTFVGLQARFFVNANGVRVFQMVKIRCVAVRLANGLGLSSKCFIIFFGRKTPVFMAMWLMFNTSQKPVHLANGDRINKLAFNSLLC